MRCFATDLQRPEVGRAACEAIGHRRQYRLVSGSGWGKDACRPTCLRSMLSAMSDAVSRLNVALEGRYAIERELGEGGMATVHGRWQRARAQRVRGASPADGELTASHYVATNQRSRG